MYSEKNLITKNFSKILEKSGKSIPQMSDDEKKEFFNKIQKSKFKG